MASPTRKFHDLYGSFFGSQFGSLPVTKDYKLLATGKIDRMRMLFHVDAFAEPPFRGSPAAVCFLDSGLDDGQLRRVAPDNNVSGPLSF